MAAFFEKLEDKHVAFIQRQSMFFIATAAQNSRINLSPKGLDSFRVFSSNLVGYLDLTGSGNETAAHIKADGRVTVMFNSFDRDALIMRLYGRGRVVLPTQAEYAEYRSAFPDFSGERQIILIDVECVQTSCGYGVPQMELVQERPTLEKWIEKKGIQGIKDYQRERNIVSIDGLETGLKDKFKA